MLFAKWARLTVLAGLIGVTACTASAAETPTAKLVRDKLSQQLQGKEITSVTPSPVKGLYEVVLNGHSIIYVDAKVDYVLLGEMVDIKNRASITQARMAELNRTDFNKLPFDQAFKEVRGNGSRKLAVFSDPDCPFCHKLENESLAGVTDVTIYTFLFPLNIHPDAERKSRLIWCAPDRDAAWRAWIDKGVLPENAGTCDTPIAKNLALGEKMAINGTPALIFANGRIVSGAIPKESLEPMLASGGPDAAGAQQ